MNNLSWSQFYQIIERFLHVNKPLQQTRLSLNRPLIVSLTSYGFRLPFCFFTLKSLANQTVLPERIILWLTEADLSNLPLSYKKLPTDLIEYRSCDELRSYKKLVPALESFPDSYIVTADDDWYFWPTWLEELINAHNFEERNITCHRAHRITFDESHKVRSYQDWDRLYGQRVACDPLIFPTNGAGTLFPPGALDPKFNREDIFLNLAPSADDMWFYFMLRLNNGMARTTGCLNKEFNWPGSQRETLWEKNRQGANDVTFSALAGRFWELNFS